VDDIRLAGVQLVVHAVPAAATPAAAHPAATPGLPAGPLAPAVVGRRVAEHPVATFPAEAQSWLAAGCEKELGWTVEVELRLASSPSDSSDAA